MCKKKEKRKRGTRERERKKNEKTLPLSFSSLARFTHLSLFSHFFSNSNVFPFEPKKLASHYGPQEVLRVRAAGDVLRGRVCVGAG